MVFTFAGHKIKVGEYGLLGVVLLEQKAILFVGIKSKVSLCAFSFPIQCGLAYLLKLGVIKHWTCLKYRPGLPDGS